MNISELFQNGIAKITGIADRLETVSASLNSALGVLEAKDAEIVSLKASLESAPKPEALVELEGKVSALEADKVTLTAEVAALPEKINAEAARIVAAGGHAPVNTVEAKDSDKKDSVTIEQFNSMPHAERNKFIRKGGKLSR